MLKIPQKTGPEKLEEQKSSIWPKEKRTTRR